MRSVVDDRMVLEIKSGEAMNPLLLKQPDALSAARRGLLEKI